MDKTNKIKVGIIGLGPVGTILANSFKKAGCDVALCDRNAVKYDKITAKIRNNPENTEGQHMTTGNIRKMTTKLTDSVEYNLPIGDENINMNQFIGHSITLTHTGTINCVNCGKKTKKRILIYK